MANVPANFQATILDTLAGFDTPAEGVYDQDMTNTQNPRPVSKNRVYEFANQGHSYTLAIHPQGQRTYWIDGEIIPTDSALYPLVRDEFKSRCITLSGTWHIQ
jgi:hypothetical protein